jgi:hypothetical protein
MRRCWIFLEGLLLKQDFRVTLAKSVAANPNCPQQGLVAIGMQVPPPANWIAGALDSRSPSA